jgi:hypothetical protein
MGTQRYASISDGASVIGGVRALVCRNTKAETAVGECAGLSGTIHASCSRKR